MGEYMERHPNFAENKIKVSCNMSITINFYRNPTPNIGDLLSNTTWNPFSKNENLFLNIDCDMTVEKLSDNDLAFQLWDSIYQCLYYVECDELTEYLHNKKSIVF